MLVVTITFAVVRTHAQTSVNVTDLQLQNHIAETEIQTTQAQLATATPAQAVVLNATIQRDKSIIDANQRTIEVLLNSPHAPNTVITKLVYEELDPNGKMLSSSDIGICTNKSQIIVGRNYYMMDGKGGIDIHVNTAYSRWFNGRAQVLITAPVAK
jgi:hypothetical protein